jgi:hypothetical protein
MNDGIAFETRVEAWLRKHRGAVFTERRARVAGRVASRGHEVDVHAAVRSTLWMPLLAFGALFGFIGLDMDSGPLFLAALMVGTCAIIAAAAHRRHIWVEAKSGEANIRRDVIWKLVSQVADARELQQDWTPSEVWIVARSGFDVDALKFAKESRIRCFLEQGGTIVEVL